MAIKFIFLGLVVLAVFSLKISAAEFRLVTGLKAPVSQYYYAIEKEAFRRIGHTVSQKELPAARAIQLTNEGIFDGDCCRIKKITSLYPNTVIVPEPVFILRFTAFTKDKSIKIVHWEDIKPYNVATVSGFKLIQIKTNEISPKSFRKLPDAMAMFHMLDAGRLDVALLTYTDAIDIIKKMNLVGIQSTLPALSEVPVYLVLHKKNVHLLESLDLTFKEMKMDGTWNRIRDSIFNQ